MQQKAFSFWGFAPSDPLTRGCASGPRWGHSPQTDSKNVPPKCLLLLPGCLDETLSYDLGLNRERKVSALVQSSGVLSMLYLVLSE